MYVLRLLIKVITPMFLAGADRQMAELRPPSIKGALRFWWRAQAGDMPIEELKQREAGIFGAASQERNIKSSFSLAVEDPKIECTRKSLPNKAYTVTRSSGKTITTNLLEYLAYGTYQWDKQDRRNVLQREYIAPDSTVKLVLRTSDREKCRELLRALRAFLVFGALGAKARNGYGSFKVMEVDGPEDMTRDLNSLVPSEEIMAALCTHNGLPSFSAFCKDSKLLRTRRTPSMWGDCMAELALDYREARLSLESRHDYSKRQYIGAPIIVDKNQESFLGRRAKPYFLRVHEDGGKYVGYLLYLPSRYLPYQYHPRLGIEEAGYMARNLQADDVAFQDACKEMNQELGKRMVEVF